MKLFLLILKNLSRNKIRSILTALAVICLVAIFDMIFSVVGFLDMVMAEQTADVMLIATERYRTPSQFDRRYVDQIVYPGSSLNTELSKIPGFRGEENHNIWHFVAFSIDPEMKDQEKSFFVIATLPEKIATMIEGLEGFDPKLAELMKDPPRSRLPNAGLLMGPDRLAKLGKRVGDMFKAKSMSHREGFGARQPIEMEFEVVGELPSESRWALGGFIDYEYLNRVLKDKKNERDGKVNLAWFRFDDPPSANESSSVIEREIRDIKFQTMSSAVQHHLQPYMDIMRFVKYGLVPIIVIVMTLVIANSVMMTVRERRQEIATMKVLGFRTPHILGLVVGEGLLLGITAGLLSSAVTYGLVNHVADGIKMPIAFFPAFFVPTNALWWGPVLGGLVAFLGGIIPAILACEVRVAEVFAKVA